MLTPTKTENFQESLVYSTGLEGIVRSSDFDGSENDTRASSPLERTDSSIQEELRNTELFRQIEKLEKQGFELEILPVPQPVLKEFELDEIPEGIGIIGGAARAILQRAAFEETAAIRDIDLVVVEELVEISDLGRHELSEQYMADDYAHGYGVDKTHLDQYFATRDFTINEIIVVDGFIIATRDAYDDLQYKIIRPTEYEGEGWTYGIGPKLMMKALLMQSVFEAYHGESSCEGFVQYGVEGFYEALALNKAFQYGGEVTKSFLKKIGHEFNNRGALMQYARQLALDYDFEFRGSNIADKIMRGLQAGNRYDENDDMFDDLPYPPEYSQGVRLMYTYPGKAPEGVNAKEY